MILPNQRLHRILVADDDREVRLGVADLLDGLGLEILHAETGTEAVELGRRTRLHAALLDMHMPGCTGVEAIPLLCSMNAGLRCIVYSGRWSLDLEHEVMAVGAFACLKKPVEPAALRNAVCAALGIQSDGWPRNN